MNFCERKKLDLDKMQTFKFATILVHHSQQSSPGLESVVSSIQEHVTSGLTHLACFTSTAKN